MKTKPLLPYPQSLAGSLLAARESVMAPIRPMLREAGVTEQQWRVLRVLKDSGAMDMTRLAEIALLHAPSVTRILRELAQRGLINRVTDSEDARRSVVTISEEGGVLVTQTARYTRLVLQEYSRRFGEERLTNLRKELLALCKAIDGCIEQP